MRTGKLSISRGRELQHGLESHPVPRLVIVPAPEVPEAPGEPEERPLESPPQSADYHVVHDRLSALERLTRLFDQGVLSAHEFAAEKAIILRLPAEELVLRADPAPPPRPAPPGPSLLGRMLGWRFLSLACVAGLAFSFATQPRETMNFLDDAFAAVSL